MRILLLVHYYFPNIQSCAQLMHDLGVELRELGHEVVIAAPDDRLGAPRTLTEEAGMEVLRVRSGRFRGVSRPLRALNEWRLPATMWRGAAGYFRDHPCDLIVNYSPTIFFGPLVKRLKRLWGCRSYLVLRDIFPQWSVDAGVLRDGGPAHRFFRHYERLLYDAADTIGVQSSRNLDYFREHGLAERHELEVLHNWTRPAEPHGGSRSHRRELGLEDRLVFFYGGNLGVAQDAQAIVRLAAALRGEPGIDFLIVGEGSEAERLRAEAERLGLDNLRFLPPVDQATYHAMVEEFDVGLITLNRDLKTHNIPGKMLDYMRCGKPILAAVNPGNDLKEIVEEHQAGFVCWNGDDDELLAGARRLAASPELRGRLGANSRALLDRLFSPAKAAAQILESARSRGG